MIPALDRIRIFSFLVVPDPDSDLVKTGIRTPIVPGLDPESDFRHED